MLEYEYSDLDLCDSQIATKDFKDPSHLLEEPYPTIIILTTIFIYYVVLPREIASPQWLLFLPQHQRWCEVYTNIRLTERRP